MRKILIIIVLFVILVATFFLVKIKDPFRIWIKFDPNISVKEKLLRIEPYVDKIFKDEIGGYFGGEKIKVSLIGYLIPYFKFYGIKNITKRSGIINFFIEKKAKIYFSDKEKTFAGLSTQWHNNLMQKNRAHWFISKYKIKLKSSGVVVIDSAPDFNHPDLKDKDFIYNGQRIWWRPPYANLNYQQIDHGIGTSCAILANIDQKGVDSIAGYPGSYLLPILLDFDGGYNIFLSDIAIGLEFLRILELRGIINFRVINMSFHFSKSSKLVLNVMKKMKDKLFVVAAGNDASDLDLNGVNGINIYPQRWNLPNKINVSATDEDDTLASFSNFGKKNVFISAPGLNITTCSKNGGYNVTSGTSYSAPYVASVAKLLFDIAPNLSVAQVKNILHLGADKIIALNGLVKGGARVNVYRSLTLLYNK